VLNNCKPTILITVFAITASIMLSATTRADVITPDVIDKTLKVYNKVAVVSPDVAVTFQTQQGCANVNPSCVFCQESRTVSWDDNVQLQDGRFQQLSIEWLLVLDTIVGDCSLPFDRSVTAQLNRLYFLVKETPDPDSSVKSLGQTFLPEGVETYTNLNPDYDKNLLLLLHAWTKYTK